MLGRYFLLVFALAAPFLVLGALTDVFLLPGPAVAALMAICPGAAALLLTWKERGRGAALRLLARGVGFAKIRPLLLYAPLLLACPAAALAVYAWLRLGGEAVPGFAWDLDRTLALAFVFFLAAVAEELGWSGYATPPLQRRMGPLGAGLLLGVIWALFHLPALLQVGRSLDWIAGWTLPTVATRVVLVRIFDLTRGSVAATALFHASQNHSWQLFPVSGSHFDYGRFGVIMAVAAVAVSWPARKPPRG